MRYINALLITVILLSITACELNFIKRRLMPPHAVNGGILFQYEAPSARTVILTGNFPDLNWDTEKQPMFDDGTHGDRMAGDGIWTIVKPLSPGRYEYKFVVDRNSWVSDPSNPDTTDDGYGGKNSLLNVNSDQGVVR